MTTEILENQLASQKHELSLEHTNNLHEQLVKPAKSVQEHMKNILKLETIEKKDLLGPAIEIDYLLRKIRKVCKGSNIELLDLDKLLKDTEETC